MNPRHPKEVGTSEAFDSKLMSCETADGFGSEICSLKRAQEVALATLTRTRAW